MKNIISLTVLNVACLLLFIGCSSTPPPHDWAASLKPQPGKGLVVFYCLHLGPSQKINIYLNNTLLTTEFRRHAFYTYQADPGQLNVYTTMNTGSSMIDVLGQATLGQVHRNAPELNIEPGQIYYLEFGPVAFGPPKFHTLVPKEEGENDIKNCEWLNP